MTGDAALFRRRDSVSGEARRGVRVFLITCIKCPFDLSLALNTHP